MESIYQALFVNPKSSWLWLVVRLYLGYQWIYAGYEKIINPAWFGSNAGGALVGFINGALAKSTGANPDVSWWYAWFLNNFILPHAVVWSYAILSGEILIGLGLVFGVFTFWAAFFGFFMNMNYLFAGTVSSNPTMLVLAILIMFAHRTAGTLGLEKFIFKNVDAWKKRRA